MGDKRAMRGAKPSGLRRWWWADPRHGQLLVLSALLAHGWLNLDFEVAPTDAGLVLLCALVAQWLFGRFVAGIPFDPRSALISALSLALLLRSADPPVLMLGVGVAIASKFLIRVRGKHVFNPTNFAIVAMVYGTDSAWVSPGQWGSGPLGAAALILAGSMILSRAGRSDVTFVFLAAWSLLLFGRSLWLGEPMAIPLHRLQSGGLLLFAFFMLSDPRTLPDARAGRVLHALVVASVAGLVQFGLHRPNGLLIALVVCAPLVPLIDALIPAARHAWPAAVVGPSRHPGARALALRALALIHIPSTRPSPRRQQ